MQIYTLFIIVRHQSNYYSVKKAYNLEYLGIAQQKFMNRTGTNVKAHTTQQVMFQIYSHINQKGTK